MAKVDKAQGLGAAACWVPLTDLERWDQNPRRNDGAPVDKVLRSIRQFGFVAPVVGWPREDGTIRLVAGDTRVKALRKALAEDPTYVPKHAPGPALVPVRLIAFGSAAEANAYAIADNRLNEEASWDDERLVKELEAIAAQGGAEMLADVGFDEGQLRDMLEGVEAPTEEDWARAFDSNAGDAGAGDRKQVTFVLTDADYGRLIALLAGYPGRSHNDRMLSLLNALAPVAAPEAPAEAAPTPEAAPVAPQAPAGGEAPQAEPAPARKGKRKAPQAPQAEVAGG